MTEKLLTGTLSLNTNKQELALDTILLLRQLVFYAYTLFGTLKIHYDYGRVVIA